MKFGKRWTRVIGSNGERQNGGSKTMQLHECGENSHIFLRKFFILLNFILGRIMSFNARRGGEVARLKIIHWKGVEDGRWKRQKDLDHLDDLEKKMAERLSICYIEGKKKVKSKKNNLVPILFTPESVAAVKILVAKREFAGIQNTNPYIFATSESFIKGWDAIQAITKKIDGLKHPKLLTPTRTRKFLATLLQLLDINEAELTWITNHMGHTKDVHMSWYRKEDSTLELTKVAKILHAVDRGEDIKNKRIDDLHVEENEATIDNPIDNPSEEDQEEEGIGAIP